jgi:YbgC/YbaW family acyl-CoA thioester hydrolase
MKRSDFRHTERLRVRWSEVDLQKIVFNAHYLTYFDTSMSGYWRALALPYEQTLGALDGDLFMRHVEVNYQGSARYDDLIEVGIRCERIGTTSITFAAAVFRQDELLVSGALVYVFAQPQDRKAMPVPKLLREAMEGFEAGGAMWALRLEGWQQLQADAQSIRTQVFIQEQGIPLEREWDAADPDPSSVHAVAYNRMGVALATGRLLEHVPGVAKIGRMAVIAPVRGAGVGRAVLDALMQAAKQRGDREAVLHARTSAASFYERAGFVARGPVFEEMGIAHVEMVRGL